jgi:hypothetical protein
VASLLASFERTDRELLRRSRLAALDYNSGRPHPRSDRSSRPADFPQKTPDRRDRLCRFPGAVHRADRTRKQAQHHHRVVLASGAPSPPSTPASTRSPPRSAVGLGSGDLPGKLGENPDRQAIGKRSARDRLEPGLGAPEG